MNIFEPIFLVAASYWWMLPVLLLITFVKSPVGKGMLGEWVVEFVLKRKLASDQYLLMHNVTLPTEDGTTQIDHIVISIFGVFVIETKNYAGWIFGGEHQKNWTQKFHRSSKSFQNPLRQNYKHVKSVIRITGVPEELVHSVVVFVGSAEFKTPMPANVTPSAGVMMRYLKLRQEKVIDEFDVLDFAEKIERVRLDRSMKTNRQHVAHVKNIVELKTRKK